MSDKPQDPSQGSIDQQERHSEGLEGQEGYGVEYEDGRYRSDNMQQPPASGRSGSFESSNTGGYGVNLRDVDTRNTADQPDTVPPDPEVQQGQGGQ